MNDAESELRNIRGAKTPRTVDPAAIDSITRPLEERISELEDQLASSFE